MGCKYKQLLYKTRFVGKYELPKAYMKNLITHHSRIKHAVKHIRFEHMEKYVKELDHKLSIIKLNTLPDNLRRILVDTLNLKDNNFVAIQCKTGEYVHINRNQANCEYIAGEVPTNISPSDFNREAIMRFDQYETLDRKFLTLDNIKPYVYVFKYEPYWESYDLLHGEYSMKASHVCDDVSYRVLELQKVVLNEFLDRHDELENVARIFGYEKLQDVPVDDFYFSYLAYDKEMRNESLTAEEKLLANKIHETMKFSAMLRFDSFIFKDFFYYTSPVSSDENDLSCPDETTEMAFLQNISTSKVFMAMIYEILSFIDLYETGVELKEELEANNDPFEDFLYIPTYFETYSD